MTYFYVLLVLIFQTEALALPLNKNQIEWICESHELSEANPNENCDLYQFENGQANKKILNLPAELAWHTGYHWLNSNLLEITMSCGTNCSLTQYYNSSKTELSEGFSVVLKVNLSDETLVTLDDRGVVYSPIFDERKREKVLIERNALSTRSAFISDSINSVDFRNHKIYIDYYDQSNRNKIVTFDQNLSRASMLDRSLNWIKEIYSLNNA